MSLIEQLGGYEKAKHILENCPEFYHEYQPKKHGLFDAGYYRDSAKNRVSMVDLKKALLQYRRQHNIFEVGDKVVHPKFSNINIYEICEISGDLFTVFYNRKSHSFKTDVRHATDAEIKAGKRLENKTMRNSLSKEDWFSVLSSLFDMHVGHDNVDEDAWIEEYEKGKSPHDAFYDEYPEYEGMED